MIPRFKPYLDKRDYLQTLIRQPDSISKFEEQFARKMNTRHATAFMYGRSAIWTILLSHGIQHSNVILPAYTCKVVAEAIVHSNNRPKFIDIESNGFNMDLDLLEANIDADTRAIIATHLFGYPVNIDRLKSITLNAEREFGHPIILIQDCAHAIGATWNNVPVANCRDVAIYGFSLSKMITTILGGMLTTEDERLFERVVQFQKERYIQHAPLFRKLKYLSYLFSSIIFFNESTYPLIDFV